MDKATIAGYAAENLPRYTSYPTAPHFTSEFEPETYSGWLGAIPAGHPVSLYVHVPYCKAMCWYCGCHTKVSRRIEPVDKYAGFLNREVDLVADAVANPVAIKHLHFGGGTPTILGPYHFDDLMGRLRKRFAFDQDGEIAIEIDPRTLTPEMAQSIGNNAINRASLGVQSFDLEVQKAINRVQSFDQTSQAIDMLKQAGIEKFNFDLIYGLPKQTTASCVKTAELAVLLKPNRISVFGYAHVPSFKKHQEMIRDVDLPGTETRMEQFDAIRDVLCAAGYAPIGLDHFALPDDELAKASKAGTLHRNFQGYTTDPCDTLIGLGASSIGMFPQGFVQNQLAVGTYSTAVSDGTLPIQRGFMPSAEDRLRSKVIERLMCDYRVDLNKIPGVDDDWLQEAVDRNEPLNRLIEQGFVNREGASLSVPAGHRFIIRKVASCFDTYLARSQVKHSKAA